MGGTTTPTHGSPTWLIQMESASNPVGRLQEICQQWKLPLPCYREGEGSYQHFGTEVTLTIAGEKFGFHSLGRTKKLSKANVAQNALDFISEHVPRYLQPPPLPVSYAQWSIPSFFFLALNLLFPTPSQ